MCALLHAYFTCIAYAAGGCRISFLKIASLPQLDKRRRHFSNVLAMVIFYWLVGRLISDSDTYSYILCAFTFTGIWVQKADDQQVLCKCLGKIIRQVLDLHERDVAEYS